MLCVATVSVDVVKLAWPDPLRVLVPRDVAPSKNSTEPAGVPVPGAVAVTVAVNVTDWPNFDGFADEDSAVLVSDFCTTCVSALDVLVLKFPSPPYSAVML